MPLYKNLDVLANTLVDRFHKNPTLQPLINVEDVVSSILADVTREMVGEAEQDAVVYFGRMVQEDSIFTIDAINKKHVLHIAEGSYEMYLLRLETS